MAAITDSVTYTITTTSASTSTATAKIVCHPVWDKNDMRNWPVWPAGLIFAVTFGVLYIFITCMFLTAYWAKKGLLKRLTKGPREELGERFRIEMVKVRMAIRREGDPPADI